MTTARKRAEEAAIASRREPSEDTGRWSLTRSVANAASGVWEPLLRDALAIIQAAGVPDRNAPGSALFRIKEALG